MRILTGIVLALAFPVLACACDGDRTVSDAADETPAPNAQAQAGEKVEDTPNNPRHRALMGKLVDSKEMAIQGQDAKHVLAKIETPSGHIVIADLGTRADLKEAKLTPGEQLEVYGVVGRLNNRPLLIAEQMGEVVNIKRTSNEVPVPTSFQRENELGGEKALKHDEKAIHDEKPGAEKQELNNDQLKADNKALNSDQKTSADQPKSESKDLKADDKAVNNEKPGMVKDSEIKTDDTKQQTDQR